MFMQVQRLRAVFGTMWRCCGRVLASALIVALIASLAGLDKIQGHTEPRRDDGSAISIHHVKQRKGPPVSPDGPDIQVVIVGFDEGEDKPVITVRGVGVGQRGDKRGYP